jgi:hypothetical protein
MAGPLLPFSYDQSRINDNNIPLNLSQSRLKKRKAIDDYDDSNDNLDQTDENNINIRYKNVFNDREKINSLRKIKTNDSLKCNNSTPGFLYSSLNSSSSVLIDHEDNHSNNIDKNINNTTVSTVLNNDTQNLSSDSLSQILNLDDNIDVLPSSPLFESQNDFFKKPDMLRSDAFDDLVSINQTELTLKPTLPSSPTLYPSMSSNNKVFQRPKLNKHIHPLSRNGSTFNEPNRKKQRMLFQDLDQIDKSKNDFLISSNQLTTNNIDFAIDRDGHVYGYLLEKDELPENYAPTLYDEPIYFVVKNSSIVESNLKKAIEQFFDQRITSKSPTAILNLQYFNLNSLSDNISDIQNFFDCTDDGIIKPAIHVDASNNNLRSINPNLLTIERLEMLSLRNNKIARLSGNINKAINLKSLNLAMNKFKFLPHNILNLKNLEVLAITGNPMIQHTSVDKYFTVNEELLRLYSQKFKNNEFLDKNKQIKYFSRIHWLKSNKQISKNALHASMLSRSLTTLQDMYYDDNGNSNDWNDININSSTNNKLKLRKIKQNYIESQIPWCSKLSELALRHISKYLISESEVEKWRDSTSEFIYKRAMNSLIYGTNGETCGFCNENCIESVADMLEWWDFKSSRSITIKRRFCSKHCAISWMNKLNRFKLIE